MSRHVLDARDVGRLKTNAMSDAVKARNPHARVVKAPMDVVAQRGELKALLLREGADLLIMATDTKSSRGVLNDLALDLGIVAIFGRTIVRASGGDVLRVRPNNNNNGPVESKLGVIIFLNISCLANNMLCRRGVISRWTSLSFTLTDGC